MIAFDEFEKVWEKVIFAVFKTLSWDSPGGTEEIHAKLVFSSRFESVFSRIKVRKVTTLASWLHLLPAGFIGVYLIFFWLQLRTIRRVLQRDLLCGISSELWDVVGG